MKTLMAFALALFVSGCAGSRIQREVGAPEWDLAPAAAAKAERIYSYGKHRIVSVEDGYSEVDGKAYGSRGMRDYFSWAQARQASALLRQARKENAKSGIFPLISVAVFGAAGALGSQFYSANQPRKSGSSYSYSEQQKQDGIATLGGLALGALVGLVIRNNYSERSHLKRIEAAESFNRHLLKKLDIKVVPEPNGARAQLSRDF